jgi:hypothetical protein
LMGALKLLCWWEFSECCLDGNCKIVVLMEALRLFNNLIAPMKTTISDLPSRQQSESSHQDNNLTAPIKTKISELPIDGSSKMFVLMGALRLLSWW